MNSRSSQGRTRLPPLNAVRVFEVAGRHLSFARASEELCVTIAVSIASGTLGLTQSLLHERFDPAIEKFVPAERRNFVRGLIAHPERLVINV